ncbi:hypothetical protein GCM10027062_34980 [Nocardioides hungaricus]
MESTDLGRAVLEDLVRAALPELVEPSRQSDPAESVSPPEGERSDARGPVGAEGAAPTDGSPVGQYAGT